MEKKNKLEFFGDGSKVRVVLKKGKKTPYYKTINSIVNLILEFRNENIISGEEFVQWIGLIFLPNKLSLTGKRDDLSNKIVEAVSEAVLSTTEVFFTIYPCVGEMYGTFFFVGGREFRFPITSKKDGYQFVWLLEVRKTISSTEAQKLIVQIEDSPLPEKNDKAGKAPDSFKGFARNN